MRDAGETGKRVALATALAFAVALGAHAIVALQYVDDPFSSQYVADAMSYDEWAARLASDGLAVEPVFHQAPLFPVLLGALYQRVAEASRATASLWLQALLASLAIALFVPIGRLWFGRLHVGLAAAGLATLYGPLVFHGLKLLPVALALATQAAAVAVLGVARLRNTAGWCALAGVAVGLAALTRAEFLLFVPVAALAVMREQPGAGRARRFVPVLALLAGCACSVLPATMHNFRQGDRVLIASSAGENLFIGNQRGARGTYKELTPRAGDIFSQRRAARSEAEQALGRKLRPSEISSWWARRAASEIAADPGGWLVLEARKLGRVLHPGDPTEMYCFPLERSLYLPALWALPLGAWTLLLLAVIGLKLSWRERRTLWPLAAWSAMHLVVLLAFFVDSRLRLSLFFSLVPFGGLAVMRGIDAWRANRRRAVLVGMASVLIATAVSAVTTRATERDYRRLSSVLSVQGRLDEALAVLEPELNRPQPDPFILDQAGWVSQKMERFADARGFYLRALENTDFRPSRARQTRTRLAMVLERLGDHGGARAQHDLAVASGLANAGTYYERGMYLLRRGQHAAARDDLLRATALDPAWPAPRTALRSLSARPR